MFRLQNLELLPLLFLPLLLVLALVWAERRRNQKLARLVPGAMRQFLTSNLSLPKRRFKQALVLFALLLLVLTLLRPQGEPISQQVTKRGRDLVFVLDLSKSMLAEDLRPNRLGRAKDLIRSVVQELKGDRVALLGFAGSSVLKSPLTSDYHFFLQVLESTSPDDISRGGTLIGDAIRQVNKKVFFDRSQKFRDVILITDGEDHESFPLEAAKAAAQEGIRIHTVGLGSTQGAAIPLRQGQDYQVLQYQGQPVRSGLDEGTLQEIARLTQGVYVPVKTQRADLGRLYREYIAPLEKSEAQSQESQIHRELFQFFLGLAILLLMAESLLGERRRPPA